MPRAAVVITNSSNEVALIERHRTGATYYLFPGGTIVEGETPSQTAVREAEEELGVRVEVGVLLAQVSFRGNLQYYFQARIVAGTFGSGVPGNDDEPGAGTYAVVWKPLATMEKLDVRPSALARALPQIVFSGPPTEPIKAIEG